MRKNMGMLCPLCHTFQQVKTHIRPPGADHDDADSWISMELQCGHEVGHEEFMKYSEFSMGILAELKSAQEKALKDAKNKIAAKWTEITAEKVA